MTKSLKKSAGKAAQNAATSRTKPPHKSPAPLPAPVTERPLTEQETQVVAEHARAVRALRPTSPPRVTTTTDKDGRESYTLGAGLPVPLVHSGLSATFGAVAANANAQRAQEVCAVLFATGANAADINGALATVREIAPANALEGLLATQLVTTQHLWAHHCRKAEDAQMVAIGEYHHRSADRLSRMFSRQVEALARLRAAGQPTQQVVTVQHVHVENGGQAVVGVANAPRGEGRDS